VRDVIKTRQLHKDYMLRFSRLIIKVFIAIKHVRSKINP
jgi:hypothetical protein